jgi:hypothetical protein
MGANSMTPLEQAREALTEALEFVEGYVDVLDGPDGQPRPNAAMLLEQTLLAALAALSKEPQALPACHIAVVGFRFDGVHQHHVPQLLLEFDPVPVGDSIDAKGWHDRDAFAAALTPKE